MKKFSKFLLIFALVSFVLFGVLISCEKEIEPEDVEVKVYGLKFTVVSSSTPYFLYTRRYCPAT